MGDGLAGGEGEPSGTAAPGGEPATAAAEAKDLGQMSKADVVAELGRAWRTMGAAAKAGYEERAKSEKAVVLNEAQVGGGGCARACMCMRMGRRPDRARARALGPALGSPGEPAMPCGVPQGLRGERAANPRRHPRLTSADLG